MPRHSLPDHSGTRGERGPRAIGPPPGQRRRAPRRRALLVATAVVVAAGAGTAVAARSGVFPFGTSCAGNTVTLRVASSPDIAPALRTVADRAGDGSVRSDGHCLDIRVRERTGAEVADLLKRGGPTGGEGGFDVWLPDSKVWVDRAAASNSAPPLETLGNVASSPLTLAAVPSAAEQLGWPKKKYSWARIADSAGSGRGPGIGSADPARSATGLLALTQIQSSAAAEAGEHDDSETAGTAAAAAAKQLAERTAPGDSQVLATLPRDGSGAEQGNPKRNRALVLSEQAAFAHNRNHTDSPGLRLFYPEDGATLLDYPYTLVNDRKFSTEKGRAASRFETLLGEPEALAVLSRHGFRPVNGDADTRLTHRAGGRGPQPYTAPPAKAPSTESVRATLGMWTITVQSARFSLVVDASASMAEAVPGRPGLSRMDVTRDSLIQGLSQFTSEDELGLWEFATKLKGKRDYRELLPNAPLGERGGNGQTQRERLVAAFGRMKPIPAGATGLYDTTLAAYRDAREHYASGKFNALVVLTDGANEDPGSISQHDLIDMLKQLSRGERPLPLIVIAVGPDADKKSATEISKATGGSAHQVKDPAEIHTVILRAVMEAGSRV